MIDTPRAQARARGVWDLAGQHAADFDTSASRPLVIDLDATLVGTSQRIGISTVAASCHKGFRDHLTQGEAQGQSTTRKPLT